jgi:DNA-binding PadR family transcriptional regulator
MESALPGAWPGRWGRWQAVPFASFRACASAPDDDVESAVGAGFRRGRAGWGGPPFGPPFGGPPWMRGGRERRPRPRRGDVRLAILTLLAEQPMHGYQIITELSGRSGGLWRPSPGSVYPTLQQLQDEGLVTSSEQDGRRTFALTESGRTEASASTDGRTAPWDQMAADDHDGAARLRERVGQAMAAIVQVSAAGTDQQLERAEQLVADLTRGLYRLLAEDDHPEGDKP